MAKPVLIVDLKVGDILRHTKYATRTLRVVNIELSTSTIDPTTKILIHTFIKNDIDGTREVRESTPIDSTRLTNNYYLDQEAMDRLELTMDMEELFNGT